MDNFGYWCVFQMTYHEGLENGKIHCGRDFCARWIDLKWKKKNKNKNILQFFAFCDFFDLSFFFSPLPSFEEPLLASGFWFNLLNLILLFVWNQSLIWNEEKHLIPADFRNGSNPGSILASQSQIHLTNSIL